MMVSFEAAVEEDRAGFHQVPPGVPCLNIPPGEDHRRESALVTMAAYALGGLMSQATRTGRPPRAAV